MLPGDIVMKSPSSILSGFFILLLCPVYSESVNTAEEFTEFELSQYEFFAKHAPEFQHVVDFLKDPQISGDGLSDKEAASLELYRNAYEFFFSGNLELLNHQKLGSSFSYLWLYPYTEDSPEMNDRALLATLDFLVKLVREIQTMDAESANTEQFEAIFGSILEARNLIGYQLRRICAVELVLAARLLAFYQFIDAFVMNVKPDPEGDEAILYWRGLSKTSIHIAVDMCPDLKSFIADSIANSNMAELGILDVDSVLGPAGHIAHLSLLKDLGLGN